MRNRIGALFGWITMSLSAVAVGSENGFEEQGDSVERYRFYVAGTVGQAQGDVGASEMNRRMAREGYNAQARVSGQDRTAWGLFGGYQYSQYLSVEAGYIDLGEVRTRLSGDVSHIRDYLDTANVVHPRSADGVEVAALVRYPLTERWGIYARGGFLYGDSDYSARTASDKAKRSHKETEFVYGVGVDVDLKEQWDLRLSYNRYPIENEDISLIALSLIYRFEER